MFNLYFCEASGLMAAAIFCITRALDIPCIIGSQTELGLVTAVEARLGVAVTDLFDECETYAQMRYVHDMVSPGPLIER